MTKPEELANQIRSLCEQIDSKLHALKILGFENAEVRPNGQMNKLEFFASKTVETKL